jgi:uncharacterized membrane protein
MSVITKKYLGKQDQQRIADKIGEVESSTSGEIRVCVREKRLFGEGKLSLHDLTLKEFYRLGMHKTKDRTGVLILLLLDERKFEIIGDEGIDKKIPEGKWDRIAGSMSAHFKDGKFAEGIIHAVNVVGEELKTHFPRQSADRNELSDDVVLE